MTNYPALIKKTPTYSFVSALTQESKYPKLMILMSRDYYQFTTYSIGKADVHTRVKHPESIEAKWIFIEYEYTNGKAKGMV